MAWQQLHIDCGADDPACYETCLEAAGALALTLTDAADDAVLEPPPGGAPPFGRAALTALFAADIDRVRVEHEILPLLGPEGSVRLRWQTLEDQQWERAWLDRFRARRFGERLWVAPRAATVDDDAIVVRLDPGLAFGTGDHETTALCLEWLDRTRLAGTRVLDYGCGSGILAIAAARLGAQHITAIDHDPQAVTAAAANAANNDVAHRIEIARGDVPPTGPFDVVVANILASVLIDLAEPLATNLAAGGSIALSGILSGQTDDVMEAFRHWIHWRSPQRRGDWALISGIRKN